MVSCRNFIHYESYNWQRHYYQWQFSWGIRSNLGNSAMFCASTCRWCQRSIVLCIAIYLEKFSHYIQCSCFWLCFIIYHFRHMSNACSWNHFQIDWYVFRFRCKAFVKLHNERFILKTVPITFFTTTAYGVFSFILLARKWPKLMQHWEFVEAILPPYKTLAQKKQMAREIHMISFIVLSVALGILSH